jgi:hypothetical protein
MLINTIVCIIYICSEHFPEVRRITVSISYSLRIIRVVVSSNVVISALFNCIQVVWHLICFVCYFVNIMVYE